MSIAENVTFSEGQIPVTNIHSNTEQTLISVTEDKLRLILNEYLSFVESKKLWIAPLSVLLTIVVVLTTSDFKDFLIPKYTWQAIFLISAGLCLIWFFMTLKSIGQSVSVDDVVRKIKNENL
ncbi:MAG: hypothetical protein LHW64_09540 [Candidatus Cloacimonetes bacterium]|nr:hypothetical protein [Candidatus Cloacimonadota bacterium]MDY0230356.1 hypothetical protein [Candidatus Cloacimonadaceae bacterium]